MAKNVLSRFKPAVAGWFEDVFTEPTAVQEQAQVLLVWVVLRLVFTAFSSAWLARSLAWLQPFSYRASKFVMMSLHPLLWKFCLSALAASLLLLAWLR